MRRLAAIALVLAAGTAAGADPPDAEPPDDGPAIELRATPLAPAVETGMRRWHQGYRQRILPVLRAWWGVALAVQNPRAPRSLEAGCRRLATELDGLALRRLPVAPDRSVSLHLEEALRALSEASASCTRGAYFLTDWRLRQAADSWAELRARLDLYGLAP